MPRDLPPEWTPGIPAVRTARQIASAAEAAARAWAQPLPAAELPVCLDMALLELSGALGQLAQYRPRLRPGTTCGNPFEPGIHIGAAAQAIACISHDLRGTADCQPGAGESQPVTAAITAARAIAGATYAAFTEIRQPSGSLPARDAAVSAFMHATGIIDTAIGNLAGCAPGPLAAILTRQRIRLEHACRSLREALVASAVSQDDQPSLAAAARVRELHPILPHRSPPRPGAPHHVAIPPAAVMPRPRFLQASRDEPVPPPQAGERRTSALRLSRPAALPAPSPPRRHNRPCTPPARKPHPHEQHRHLAQGSEKK